MGLGGYRDDIAFGDDDELGCERWLLWEFEDSGDDFLPTASTAALDGWRRGRGESSRYGDPRG